MKGGPRQLTFRGRLRTPGPAVCLVGALLFSAGGCEKGVPPELQPDSVLRAELGLTEADEVHRVTVRGARGEEVTPEEVTVPPSAWVEFVVTDWRVHEVHFEVDSLSTEGLRFLTRTSQLASPPLVHRDARFVVSFREAPEGRYPFRVEGNTRPGRGVVIVRARR